VGLIAVFSSILSTCSSFRCWAKTSSLPLSAMRRDLVFTRALDRHGNCLCALVSRPLAQAMRMKHGAKSSTSLLLGVVYCGPFLQRLFGSTSPLSSRLWGRGGTVGLAVSYLRIIVPSLPLLSLAWWAARSCAPMATRAIHDCHCGRGAVNAILDPILIFVWTRAYRRRDRERLRALCHRLLGPTPDHPPHGGLEARAWPPSPAILCPSLSSHSRRSLPARDPDWPGLCDPVHGRIRL
jgi:hypothetical protein